MKTISIIFVLMVLMAFIFQACDRSLGITEIGKAYKEEINKLYEQNT